MQDGVISAFEDPNRCSMKRAQPLVKCPSPAMSPVVDDAGDVFELFARDIWLIKRNSMGHDALRPTPLSTILGGPARPSALRMADCSSSRSVGVRRPLTILNVELCLCG